LKARIIRSFSRAASTYDAYADVQREVAGILAESLGGLTCGNILEIGCGTGLYTLLLAEAFPAATIRSIDISAAMVERAGEKLAHRPLVLFEQADGENLPASLDGPFDLITANGVFQWFFDLEKAVGRYGEMLAASGSLVFSVFGPETLHELNEVLGRVLGTVSLPVRSFPDRAYLARMLAPAFESWSVKERRLSRAYSGLLSLLRTLKGTGVSPGGIQGPLRLTTSRVLELEGVYRRHFGSVYATYQVFVCKGRRGAA
jgi:malonyl-CoA O-methyltransferase